MAQAVLEASMESERVREGSESLGSLHWEEGVLSTKCGVIAWVPYRLLFNQWTSRDCKESQPEEEQDQVT